jgi:hypothetical protein
MAGSRRLFGESDLDVSDEFLRAKASRQVLEAVVPLRLTRRHKDQLAEIAREMGLSLSAYLRQVVLGAPLPPRKAIRPIPELNQRTYVELGRVGADLSELVQLIREGARPDHNDFVAILELIARSVGDARRGLLGLLEPTGEDKGE